MNNGQLSAKQDRFCQEYVVDCNATQAAIRAGYSKRTANEQGSQLLAKLSIQNRVAELQKPICDKLELDAAYVIERLQRNEREAYEAGNLRESTRCLELLGKTIALFTERVEVDQQVLLGCGCWPHRWKFLWISLLVPFCPDYIRDTQANTRTPWKLLPQCGTR